MLQSEDPLLCVWLWENERLYQGYVADAVAELRREPSMAGDGGHISIPVRSGDALEITIRVRVKLDTGYWGAPSANCL